MEPRNGLCSGIEPAMLGVNATKLTAQAQGSSRITLLGANSEQDRMSRQPRVRARVNSRVHVAMDPKVSGDTSSNMK